MSRWYHWHERCPEHPEAGICLCFGTKYVGAVCAVCERPLKSSYKRMSLEEWQDLGKPGTTISVADEPMESDGDA
jgi:hypothetical protein